MVGLFSILKQFVTDKEFQRLSIFVIFVLFAGALFYHSVEEWGWLDSIYFCVTTLTTVGYGDFAPATDGGKIFTIFYIIVGIGVLLGYINVVAKIAIKHKFGFVNLITEKTKDIGEKTMQLGRKVHGEPRGEIDDKEFPPKKPLNRQKPMRKFKTEEYTKRRLK